jgi:hypothetical protein
MRAICREQIIETAEECPVTKAEIPSQKDNEKTIAWV